MRTWNDVIGHDWAVELLENSIVRQRISHAYLLTGPSNVGKVTLARVFAQALNCEQPDLDDRPCGRCRACNLIALGRHPDVRQLSGHMSKRGTRSLKIDQIRELQQSLSLTSAEARFKVAIIEDFENATIGATNAFLKTLEEPAANVIIILTAADTESLLPTISSRCQLIGLRPIPVSLIAGALHERWNVSDERAELLAHLSDGRLGWAISAAKDPTLLEAREKRLEILQELLGKSYVDRFMIASQLASRPEELLGILRCWLTWWRDVSMLATRDDYTDTLTNVDLRLDLLRYAGIWERSEIIASLRGTEQAIWQLRGNINTRLLVENLLIHYPRSD